MKAPTNNYHAKWRAMQKASLPGNFRETKAYVSSETYERVVSYAADKERLPVTIGRLLDLAVSVIEGQDPAMARREFLPEPTTLKVPADALLTAILNSRFPDDTGAARMRQFAFVQIVADQNAKGIAPTATEMADLTGAHRAQMDLLSKQLRERGVIDRKHAPGHKGAKSAKLLMIAEDALERLNAIHIEQTGEPLEGSQALLNKIV